MSSLSNLSTENVGSINFIQRQMIRSSIYELFVYVDEGIVTACLIWKVMKRQTIMVDYSVVTFLSSLFYEVQKLLF